MIELLTTAEMAEADRLAITGGIAGIKLMENAGRAVADAIAARNPAGIRVAVVAGPGNNGGDGFVAARVLTEPATPEALAGADVVIDALFGAGLDRPVQGRPRDMIAAMNAAPCVYAVDLPSGINGTSGAIMGLAVTAAHTVTFFRRKAGHVLLPGRLHGGNITVADIGIPASVLDRIKPQTSVNDPRLWGERFPLPQAGGHKYARGHAVVVSGPSFSTGAARLAARGALRAGAGRVTLASPRVGLASLAVMVRPVDDARELGEFLADPRRNALVLGPGVGVGQDTRDLALAALSARCAVVLDADALTSFADESAVLTEAVRKRAQATILTPHEGEFGRLFKGMDRHALSKLERARKAAAASGAVILLKGADTVVASPDGRAAIAENAPSWLATAGSGDVLAGVVAACLAQGMPSFEAAAAAVWLHGEAAAATGPGLIAEDLPEAMPTVYRRLFAMLSARSRESGDLPAAHGRETGHPDVC